MTDLLIRGVEMPEDGMIGVFISSDRNVYDSMDNIIGTIVPIPPHGRLIDADALMLAILDAQVDQPELAEVYDEDYHVVLDWLRAAPTVIEAEE